MAANGSPPALINVNLSIAETITAIDKIMERLAARKAALAQDFFADLRDNLDVIDTAIKALDNMFVALVDAYSEQRDHRKSCPSKGVGQGNKVISDDL